MRKNRNHVDYVVIYALYKRGVRAREIAEVVDCSEKHVYCIVRKVKGWSSGYRRAIAIAAKEVMREDISFSPAAKILKEEM